MAKWKYVSDEWPETYETVVVRDNENNIFIAYHDGNEFREANLSMPLNDILAWAEIPDIDIELNANDMELGNLLWGNSRGNYKVDRSKWQDMMQRILEFLNCDNYGLYYGDNPNEWGGVTTEHFITRPYYWGDDEEIACLPNFEYHNVGLDITIDWYKYPLRDSYSNIDISHSTWEEMLTIAIGEELT